MFRKFYFEIILMNNEKKVTLPDSSTLLGLEKRLQMLKDGYLIKYCTNANIIEVQICEWNSGPLLSIWTRNVFRFLECDISETMDEIEAGIDTLAKQLLKLKMK